MAELNVVGVGVATADSELRQVGEQKVSVCTVNLAFNRSYKDKEQKWQQEVCFIRAQVWGSRADKMAELVKKGQPVYVNGYMKQDTWEKDGQKRVSYSMTLRDFQLVEKNGKKKGDSQPEAASVSAPSQPVEDDPSIPF